MLSETPWTVVRGFCMGAADVVPGVSGGTIALVFGIYQRLVASIRAGSSALGRIVRMDGAGALTSLRRVEWGFLLPLLGGVLLAVVTLAGVIGSLLEDYPIQMAALFLGLIAGSVAVVWRLVTKRDGTRIAIAAAVGVALFVVLGLREGTSEESVTQFANPALWAFLLSGAIAICAMILPGISGSFILVLLGMYGAVLDAVTERDLLVLAVFGLGAVVGLALFSQALHWSLETHYDSVLAALLGLMLGSARVLWPWPDGLDSTTLASPDQAIVPAVLLGAGAFAVVLVISGLARRAEVHSDATAP